MRLFFRIVCEIESILMIISISRCLFLGTKRCDGTITEGAKDIPLNTPLRQRIELLRNLGDNEKPK